MGTDLAKLPNDTEALRLLIVEQEKKYLLRIDCLERNAEILSDELELLRHKIFGRRSEKLTEEERQQMRLFDEAESGSGEEKPVEII